MRGDEQGDSCREQYAPENHGEKNGPAKGGATLVAGFKGEDASGGWCIDETSVGPAFELRFEFGLMGHRVGLGEIAPVLSRLDGTSF